MLRISKVVIISVLIFTQLAVWAQNNTNSPYTRFGYGELADRSFGAGRAMGGVGIGLRSSKQINPLNPASYSCMDSLTFLFDFGVSGQVSWFDDGNTKQHQMNGNVEYIAMQFPITRRLAVSIGLLPFSHVGYEFGGTKSEAGLTWAETFTGSGSLSEMYGGLSFDIWKKRLAVGANFGFLFGNFSHERNLIFASANADDVQKYRRYDVRDFLMDFGVQYTHPLSKEERVTVGVTYSPGQKLNTTLYDIQLVGSGTSSSYTVNDTIKNYRYDLPNSFGFGLSYVKDNKLTVAADLKYENWEDCYFDNEKGLFKNRMRIALGGEYIPAYRNRNYFGRINYRAGFHYSNSYLRVGRSEENSYKGHGYNEYGASIGLGLPLIDNRSYVNLSFEYVKIHPEIQTMIDEQYFRFTVNYSFNELWFFKRKVN